MPFADCPDIVKLVNVGDDVIAISCGVDSVIAPDVFAILIWFVVPVMLAAIGYVPVRPINSCPFVRFDPVSTLLARYIALLFGVIVVLLIDSVLLNIIDEFIVWPPV